MAALIAALALASADSTAQGAILKNGVKVGDRSAMTIIRAPRSNTRKRIQPLQERKAAPSPRSRRQQQHTWFWEAHPPQAAADPARWDAALATLRTRRAAGSVITPAARVGAISETWRAQITTAARKHRISEILILGVMTAESLGKPRAQSHKGAQGLMQLIPATAKRFGVTDSFDPAQNIDGGAAYLAWLLNRFGEDPILALAGYNAGEGAVDKYGGVPPFTETRDYVAKVFDAIAAAEALCHIRPEGPRRSCLWRQGGES